MDFSRTLVKPAAFPSEVFALSQQSQRDGGIQDLLIGLRLLYGPGYSSCLSLLLRINGWMNEKEKKTTSGYAWPWKDTLFSNVFPSYVWMISLLLRPPHLYLSLVTLPGSVLFFLHGAIVCPYMHAHTHSHPTDFILLRVWAGLEEPELHCSERQLSCRWAPLMLSTGSSLWAQLNQPEALKCYETYL